MIFNVSNAKCYYNQYKCVVDQVIYVQVYLEL